MTTYRRYDRAIPGEGLTQPDPRNILPHKPYRWRGVPGWRPEDVQPVPGRPLECGTNAGYKRHRARGEVACQPCKDAEAKYVRDRNARKAMQP